MRISDWSSDVCSSDLGQQQRRQQERNAPAPVVELVAQQPLAAQDHEQRQEQAEEIGRASCRERVCQYVSISVVAVSLKKKKKRTNKKNTYSKYKTDVEM